MAALALVVSAAALSGCGSDMASLLNSSPTISEPSALRPAEGKPISRMIAYRPALGPPDDIGNELTRQLNDAAVDQGLALIIDTRTPTDLGLRGYLTAMRKGPTVNVTYLWDVVDAKGQRVHRISGEEALANGVDVKQPWAAVTPAVARMIAQKAMGDIGQWARSQGTPAPGAPGAAPGSGAPPNGAPAPTRDNAAALAGQSGE